MTKTKNHIHLSFYELPYTYRNTQLGHKQTFTYTLICIL